MSEQLSFFDKPDETELAGPEPQAPDFASTTHPPENLVFSEVDAERLGVSLNADGTIERRRGIGDGLSYVQGLGATARGAVADRLSASHDPQDRQAARDIKDSEWLRGREKEEIMETNPATNFGRGRRNKR